MGAYDVQEVQIYKEAAFGVTGVPTARLMLLEDAVFTPKATAKVFRQLHGSLGVGGLGARIFTGGDGNLKGVFSYEDANYYLENIFGIVTPSGAGPYVRVGAAPLLVGSLNPRFMSLMKGDTDGAYLMTGAMIEELTITCEQNETKSELMFDAKLICKSVTSGATLAVLSDRVVLPITAADFSVFLDLAAAAPGTTALPLTAFGFELKLINNRKHKQHLGNIGIDAIDQLAWEPDKQLVKLDMEFNATSKPAVDAILTAAPWQRNLRLKATNGANVMQFDIGLQAKNAPLLYKNKNGIKAVDVECEALETVGLGNWFKYSNTTALALLL